MSAASRLRRARPVALAEALARGLADPARVRTILAVKSHDQLGDLLVAAPAVAALRARFPAARLVLVTRPYLAPLARRLPGPDAVWELPPPTRLVHFVHVVQNVHRLRPDLAFVLNSVSRSGTADALAALSRARLVVGRSGVGAGASRLGVAPPGGGAGAPDAVYDLDLPMAGTSVHQVERVMDLVRWTGAEAPGPPRLVLSAAERAAGRDALAGAIASAGAAGASRAAGAAGAAGAGPRAAPRVGFHPAAANPAKCWPGEAFLELAVGLAQAGALPVVFDTPKEPGPAAALRAGLAARRVRAGWWPAGPLEALLGPCAALDLMVCNDSGILHAAAALGVATLSFHSLGRPAEWAPRSPRAIALHAERIADIGVGAALDAATRLLAAPRASGPADPARG